MKTIRSTVTFSVPHWNFCNSDRIDITGNVPKETCRFCVKAKGGRHCMLYDEGLGVDSGGLIRKVPSCCSATVSSNPVVNAKPAVPTVPPKDIVKMSIDAYRKAVSDLIGQGYPRGIAEQAARKMILEG